MNCGKELSKVEEKPEGVPFVTESKKQNNEVNRSSIKKLIPIFIVTLVLVSILIATISDSSKVEKSRNDVEESRIQKILSEPGIYDLKINNFQVKYSSSYTTITGTVTNTSSSKDIDYYKIKAKYYSGGSVEETDWTNGTDIGPGETRSFSIMTKGFWTKDDVKLSVEEVS